MPSSEAAERAPRKLGRKATRETIERRDKLRGILAGSGRALTNLDIAKRLDVNPDTLYKDLKVLRAEVPEEEAAALPSHVLLMLNRAEATVLSALNAAAKPTAPGSAEMMDADKAVRLAMKLAELQERRIVAAVKLGLVQSREPGWALAGRVDPRTQAFEFVMRSLPQLTMEQQEALLREGATVIEAEVREP